MADIEKFFTPPRERRKKKSKNEKVVPVSVPSSNKSGLKIALTAAAIFLFLGSLGAGSYFYWQYRNFARNFQAGSGNESREILDKIGKTLELPGEVPLLATVADREKLSGQPFFRNAENGDKIFIFSEARKALLYRPSNGKVIDMASLSSSEKEDVAGAEKADVEVVSESEDASEEVLVAENGAEKEISFPVTVSIYNASGKNGIAAKIAEKIADLEEVEIKEKETAKKVYPVTKVIDFSGENEAVVEKIISLIGGEAGEIPPGESPGSSQILILAGKENANL